MFLVWFVCLVLFFYAVVVVTFAPPPLPPPRPRPPRPLPRPVVKGLAFASANCCTFLQNEFEIGLGKGREKVHKKGLV